MTAADANALCLSCGLCCNGVIFADVQLQRGDRAEQLKSLGLKIKTQRGQQKFTQSCAALDGCRCQIYAERPTYCRQFECALFKQVDAHEVRISDALLVIKKAHRRAEKVRRLLRQLGDKDETVSLGVRFRRVAKRLQKSEVEPEAADYFGQLTLAYHNLNMVISGSFYPGHAED